MGNEGVTTSGVEEIIGIIVEVMLKVSSVLVSGKRMAVVSEGRNSVVGKSETEGDDGVKAVEDSVSTIVGESVGVTGKLVLSNTSTTDDEGSGIITLTDGVVNIGVGVGVGVGVATVMDSVSNVLSIELVGKNISVEGCPVVSVGVEGGINSEEVIWGPTGVADSVTTVGVGVGSAIKTLVEVKNTVDSATSDVVSNVAVGVNSPIIVVLTGKVGEIVSTGLVDG